MHTLTDHTQPLLDNFFERASDRHDFTNRLHAGTDFARYTNELRQVPTRDFTNQVIQLRSHVCRIRSSHFTNLVERIAQCNLSGNECQRISCSLRSQSRRTGQTSIYLDHTVVVCFSIECILNVTFTHDTQVTDTLCREVLQHLHLFVSQ